MLIAAVGLVCVSFLDAFAQARPSFAGEWVRADSANRPSVAATGDAGFRQGDMGSGWDSPLSITQGGDSLFVEYARFSAYDLQPKLRFAFALNGAESRNFVMIGHSEGEQRSRVSWSGATLIIETVYRGPAAPGERPANVTVRRALTLDTPTTLSIETTYLAPSGAASSVIRSTWTKR